VFRSCVWVIDNLSTQDETYAVVAAELASSLCSWLLKLALSSCPWKHQPGNQTRNAISCALINVSLQEREAADREGRGVHPHRDGLDAVPFVGLMKRRRNQIKQMGRC